MKTSVSSRNLNNGKIKRSAHFGSSSQTNLRVLKRSSENDMPISAALLSKTKKLYAESPVKSPQVASRNIKSGQSTSKAKSPMQCAEIVFGNLTNFDQLNSSRNSPSPRVASPSSIPSREAFSTAQFTVDDVVQQECQASNNAYEGHARSYSHLTTEQLLKMVETQNQKQQEGVTGGHNRSKTMPEFLSKVPTQEYQTYHEEETRSTQEYNRQAQLSQENMILTAEKANLQSELIFYKNELAKLCLRMGTQFPVYCNSGGSESSLATTQNFAEKSDCTMKKKRVTKENVNQQSCSESSEAIQGGVDPRLFYKSKQVKEDRYTRLSKGVADQVAQPLSHRGPRMAKPAIVLDKKSQSTTQRNTWQKAKTCQQSVTSLSHRSCVSIKHDNEMKSVEAQESSIALIQSPEKPELTFEKRSAKRQQKSKAQDKENSTQLRQSGHIPDGTTEIKKSQGMSVQQVTVNLDMNRKSFKKLPEVIRQSQGSSHGSQATTAKRHPLDESHLQPPQCRRRRRGERAHDRLSSQYSSLSKGDKSEQEKEMDREVAQQALFQHNSEIAEANPDEEDKSASVTILELDKNAAASKGHLQERRRSSQNSSMTHREFISNELLPYEDCQSLTPSHVPSKIKFERITNASQPTQLAQDFHQVAKEKLCNQDSLQYTTQNERKGDYETNAFPVTEVKEQEDDIAQQSASNNYKDQVLVQNQSLSDDQSNQSETLSQETIDRHLSVYAKQVFSPLREKEKKLESSQRELQQKLAKVMEEINQLSEMPQSLTTMTEGQQQVTTPDRFGSTLSLPKAITMGTVERDDADGGRQEDEMDRECKEQFEREILKLRQQLENFNEEEQKVMQELQVTRTLRKVQESELQGALIGNLDISQSSDSFQLHPQRLVFDSNSQKSSCAMLSSPQLSISNPFLVTNNMLMTNQFDVSHDGSKMTDQSVEQDGCESASYQSATSAQQRADHRKQIQDQVHVNIIEYKEVVRSNPNATGQTEQHLISINESNAYQTAVSSSHKSTQQQQEINAKQQYGEDMRASSKSYLTQNGPCAGLQFSQIIEEEHESESAVDNTTTGNHSRCTSIQANTLAPNLDHGGSQIIEYLNFVSDANSGCQTAENLQKVSERTSAAPEDKSKNFSALINAVPLVDHMSDIKLFNDLPLDDSSLSYLDKHSDKASVQQNTQDDALPPSKSPLLQQTKFAQTYNATDKNTLKNRQAKQHRNGQSSLMAAEHEHSETKEDNLQKLEKLIQETQQSDEGSLLRHIQRNLQQLQSNGDYTTRFQQLQQQKSPSPLKSQRALQQAKQQANSNLASTVSINKKYLESNEHNCSVDTQKLITDFQQEVALQQQANRKDSCNQFKETVGTGTLDRKSQMSETIQFLAAAQQTGNTLPMASYRSSVAQDFSPSCTGNTQERQGGQQLLPSQKFGKSRNGVMTQAQSTGDQNSGTSAPSIQALETGCQIKILQNVRAAETMSSGGGLNQQLCSLNSLDRLSKASPYFQEHSTFELTKQFGAGTAMNDIHRPTVNQLLTQDSREGFTTSTNKPKEQSFMERAQADSKSGEVTKTLSSYPSLTSSLNNQAINVGSLIEYQRSIFEHKRKSSQSSSETSSLMHSKGDTRDKSSPQEKQLSFKHSRNKSDLHRNSFLGSKPSAQILTEMGTQQQVTFSKTKSGVETTSQTTRHEQQQNPFSKGKTQSKDQTGEHPSKTPTVHSRSQPNLLPSRYDQKNVESTSTTKKNNGGVVQQEPTSGGFQNLLSTFSKVRASTKSNVTAVTTETNTTPATRRVQKHCSMVEGDEMVVGGAEAVSFSPRTEQHSWQRADVHIQEGESNLTNSKTDQKDSVYQDEREQMTPVIKKSASQAVIEMTPTTRQTKNSIYGNRRICGSSASYRSPKTQLMRPVRQQQNGSISGSQNLANSSSGFKTETRSSYNIYKRNSIKIAKNSDCPDLNKGLIGDQDSSFNTLKEEGRHHYDRTDTQVMLHAASQSTLNLEQRSPFTHATLTPNQGICALKSKNQDSLAARANPVCHSEKRTRIQKRTSSSSMTTLQGGAQSNGRYKERNYEDSYDDYINGKCEGETNQCRDIITKNHEVQVQQNNSRNNVGADGDAKRRTVDLPISTAQHQNKHHMPKTKSLSCLGGQTSIASNKPSPYLQKCSAKDSQLSGNFQSSYTAATLRGKYSSVVTPSTLAHKQQQQTLTTTKSSVFATYRGGASASAQGQPYPQQVSKVNKTQRSAMSSSASQKQLIGSCYTDGVLAQSQNRAGSARGGEVRVNGKNVVLFSENQASANHQTQSQYQRSTTPSYMQPIQQKFKRQTLKMVQEKEAKFQVNNNASQTQTQTTSPYLAVPVVQKKLTFIL